MSLDLQTNMDEWTKAASDALTDKHVCIEDDTERWHQTNEKVIMLRKERSSGSFRNGNRVPSAGKEDR